MPETSILNQCPHCKIVDPMSGVYCIHCGLLMSSLGVTGEKATPGAAAVAGTETMLHCPNCGGGNSRDNSVCGWCEAVLPWARANAEAANVAPEVIAATLPSAPTAAPVPTPAASVATPVVAPTERRGPAAAVLPAPETPTVPAPVPVIDETVLDAPTGATSQPWVLFASLTGFAVAATLIVWMATKRPATLVLTAGPSPSSEGTTPGTPPGGPASGGAPSGDAAPDVDTANQAVSDAQAELQLKTDAAEKATVQANLATRRAADARKQLEAAKAQGPKDTAALAAAQDKVKQAQADAEEAQSKAKSAQEATDAANARADQAARDAAAALAQARAAEAAVTATPVAEATPAAEQVSSRLAVRFLRATGDTVKLIKLTGGASVDMRVEAVVTSGTGENVSRAYLPNVGRKAGLVTRVYYDVRGPNEELVVVRRPAQLRWDGGISLIFAKSVESDSASQVAASLPLGTYTFRVFRNANDNVSLGQNELTLTN